MTFGKKLKLLRENKGITQKELASHLGITRSRLSLYEIDGRQPDHDLTAQLADFFGVTTDYLLGRTDSPYRPKNKLTLEEKEQLREKFKSLSLEEKKAWLTWFINNISET